MNFGLAKSIDSLKGIVYSRPIPHYPSAPAIDLVNPGISLKIYQEITPILNSAYAIHKSDQKDIKFNYDYYHQNSNSVFFFPRRRFVRPL